MKALRSFFLWGIGLLFFLFSFIILVFCLFFLSKQTTFGTARFLFRILIWLMGIKLKVTGENNIQPGRPYLIMGNHQSIFDVFVIPVAIPLVFVGIEASYHFSLPVWGYLIRKWGNIPIERRNLKKALASLEAAKQTLSAGMDIAVLPEGHRTVTGDMGPFKKGPFHLAKGSNADILPFGINGLFEFNKKNSLVINPGIVHVNIGQPIGCETIKDLSVEELRQKIHSCVSELSRKTKSDQK